MSLKDEALRTLREECRLKTERIAKLERESAQWQESCGQNFVRATEAEMREEFWREEAERLKAEIQALKEGKK